MEESQVRPWEARWKGGKEIGQGGQGIVTEVVGTGKTPKRGVLKQIVSHWVGNAQARERLENEAETLKKLHTAGADVPEVYESSIGNADSEPYIVMEFVDGTRFDKWIDSSAPVPLGDALAITEGVAKTIDLCHRHDIGHRDIKPTNIILRDGNAGTPCVLDFGIAFDSQQTIILTNEGETFRNEFITLPECQDLEGGHRDKRSDITALAGIFFCCLTGRSPLVLLDAQQKTPQERHQRALLGSVGNAEVAERLNWFFDTGLAYRISERFQSLPEFLGALRKFQKSDFADEFDLSQELNGLGNSVLTHDRKVQLKLMSTNYSANLLPQIAKVVRQAIDAEKDPLVGASTSGISMETLGLAHQLKSDGAESLSGTGTAFVLAPQHVGQRAVAFIYPVARGQKIELHLSGFFCKNQNSLVPHGGQPLEWSKVAVLDAASEDVSSTVLQALSKAVVRQLARAVSILHKATYPKQPEEG